MYKVGSKQGSLATVPSCNILQGPLNIADPQEGEYGLETDNTKWLETIHARVYVIDSSKNSFPLFFVIRFQSVSSIFVIRYV